MSHDQIQQLKRLKSIEPDQAFLKRSRASIFAASKPKTFSVFSMSWAWGAASVMAIALIALTVSVSFLPAKPVLSAALDQQSLNNELSDLTINIQLKEIRYEGEINSAISEIRNSETKHLNGLVIENEIKDFTIVDEKNSDVDGLLNDLISK